MKIYIHLVYYHVHNESVMLLVKKITTSHEVKSIVISNIHFNFPN